MPIRTQFDTSSYLQGRGRQTSLGEVMGAVQSIQGLVGNARAMKQQEQALDDDKYLNDLYAKTFSGWDGKDINDFQTRNAKVMSEVASGRSHLYNKALGIGGQLQGALQKSAIYQEDMASKKLQREKDEWEYDTDRLDYVTKQQDYIGEQLALVAEGKQDYKAFETKIRRRPGLEKANIPTEEQFFQNPEAFYDVVLSQARQTDELKNQLEVQAARLGIEKSKKDLGWQDRINQAKIDKMNQAGTKGGAGKTKPVNQTIALQLSGTQQGIDMLDNLVENKSFESLTNSPLDKLRALNPWDEDVSAFNQLIATTKQVIGKGLEGGVLRKEDEFKYEKILPKLGEPLNIREKKAQQLRDMLVNKYNTDLSSLASANVDVSLFSKAIDKKYGEKDTSDFEIISVR